MKLPTPGADAVSGLRRITREGRRLIIFVLGVAMILGGVVMLVIPGPGWLFIFAGLSVLSLEFAWAQRLLRTLKAKASRIKHKWFNHSDKRS